MKCISARLGAESSLGSQHGETAQNVPLVNPQVVQAAVKTQIVKTVTQRVEELDDGEQESNALRLSNNLSTQWRDHDLTCVVFLV